MRDRIITNLQDDDVDWILMDNPSDDENSEDLELDEFESIDEYFISDAKDRIIPETIHCGLNLAFEKLAIDKSVKECAEGLIHYFNL